MIASRQNPWTILRNDDNASDTAATRLCAVLWLIDAPSWVDTDRFDVEAKTEETSAGPIPREKLQPMLQTLLEDRFQLKVDREQRELPMYLLIVGKGGSKLK